MRAMLGIAALLLTGCFLPAARAGEDSAPAPKVRPERPRVFIRQKAWDGPSVEKLREFMKSDEFKRMSAKLPDKIGSAVKYLAGDEAAGKAAVANLKSMDIHGDLGVLRKQIIKRITQLRE